MERPLVSVIMPVYNGEQFVEKGLRSVFSQTYENLEVLAVNDGSKDRSGEILDALAAGEPRLTVFHKENGGASSARNVGIRAAKGAYLAFIDADDTIDSQMIENLVTAALEAGDRKDLLIQIGRDEVTEAGEPLPSVLEVPAEKDLMDSEAFIRSLLLYTGDSSFCTKLVPAALLKEHPFPEGVMGEDFLLHMELLPEIAGVLRIPGIGYHVVHRMGSVTRKAGINKFSKSFEAVIRHADYVEEKVVPVYPSLQREAVRFGLYVRLDYLLHVPVEDMNGANGFYADVVRYVRQHGEAAIRSPYLTKKDKIYLLLLGTAPRFTRRFHRLLRGRAMAKG